MNSGEVCSAGYKLIRLLLEDACKLIQFDLSTLIAVKPPSSYAFVPEEIHPIPGVTGTHVLANQLDL